MKKVLWAKIGWADRYQGDLVRGNFDHPRERRAEMFNFLPDEDGTYYGYTGYMVGSPPTSAKNDGWLIIFLAREPKKGGMQIVGWFEDATLSGGGLRTDVAYPEPGPDDPQNNDDPDFTVTATTAYLVPPVARTLPLSHKSIGSSKFSYLSGPEILKSKNKVEVRKELLDRIKKLRRHAILNPSVDVDLRKVDPLLDFGTAELRARVEKAAIKAVRSELKALGFSVKSHEHLNRGYDLKATNISSGEIQRIEVKGTAYNVRRFFISANEHRFRSNLEWRFALVTNALGKAKVEMMALDSFEQEFDLEPMVWTGREKAKVPA